MPATLPAPRRTPRRLAASLLAAASAAAPSLAAPPLYRITEVGIAEGFEQAWPAGISDHGEVVGQMERPSPDLGICPFVWSPTSGLHRCDTVYPRASLNVRGINRNGLVAAQRYDGSKRPYPFTWSPVGGFKRLERPGPGTWASVFAVNNAGEVVGSSNSGAGLTAAVWRPGLGLVELRPAGYDGSVGYDINKHGAVAAQLMVGFTIRPGVIDRDGQATEFPCLGNVAGDCTGRSWGLNNIGQVVGEHQYPDDWQTHGFVWSAAGGIQALTAGGPYAAFSSHARDINDRGEAVGTMSGRIDGVEKNGPFRWDAADGAHFLADLIDPADPLAGRVRFLPNTTIAINQAGTIVLTGWIDNVFDARALVLTPVR